MLLVVRGVVAMLVPVAVVVDVAANMALDQGGRLPGPPGAVAAIVAILVNVSVIGVEDVSLISWPGSR